jgi:hypothetical protein
MIKFSLALAPRQPVSRETALGCLAANIALPGSGSLLAGRISGYPQVLLALCGMGFTLGFGARFLFWCFANWSRLHSPQADPIDSLKEIWMASRWALLGIGLFAMGWLWALGCSLMLVASIRSQTQSAHHSVEKERRPPSLPGPGLP